MFETFRVALAVHLQLLAHQARRKTRETSSWRTALDRNFHGVPQLQSRAAQQT